MSDMDNLTNSAKRYKEKKERCLEFLAAATALAQKYEDSFPDEPAKDGESPGQSPVARFQAYEDKVKAATLKILVAGQFKQGKSTIINALLGEEVLPAYSTPCTAVITEVLFGEEKQAALSFKEHLGQLPAGISQRVREHVGNRHENIPELMISARNIDDLDEFLVIPEDETKEQKEAVAESPYAVCRLSWPLELCRNEVEIIDSPGLNEATARDDTTYKYVPNADMILHVLNANQLYGKPDKEFVEKLQKYGEVPLLFLVNRFDQLNTERDRERVRERAYKELEGNTVYGRQGIFFLSAWKALNGRMNEDSNEFRDSGFEDFEARMAEIIENDRGRIKLRGNMEGACNALDAMVDEKIKPLRHKLDANLRDLEAKFAANQDKFARLNEKKERIARDYDAKIANINRRLRTQIKGFFRDFRADKVEEVVTETPIELPTLGGKSSQDAAARELAQALSDALRAEFQDFNGELAREIEEDMRDLRESLQSRMEDFMELLNEVRVDLDMELNPDSATGNIHMADVGMDELLPDMLAGAAVGGAGAAAALFLASRFITVLGGPIGWGIGIATTLAAAIWAIMGSTAREDKFRKSFITAAKKDLGDKVERWVDDIASQFEAELERQKAVFMEKLDTAVALVREPIEKAIQLLKENQGNVDAQKQLLDKYAQEFTALGQQGKRLLGAI